MTAAASLPSAAPLPPGSTIGMLGAGQLGRMTALAAARLGYKVHVFAPDAVDSPTAQVCARQTAAGWDDWGMLESFAKAVDVVTLEWENVPVATVDFLHRFRPVHPGSHVLAVAQNRLAEKSFANKLGIATAPWRPADSLAELTATVADIGTDCIVKTTQLGYDGKGQIRVSPASDMAAAWTALAHGHGNEEGASVIVEGLVDFACEVSVIVARRTDGEMASYPVVENRHANGILAVTHAPADVSPSIAARAQEIARTLASALQLVGLLAVEMFVTADGAVLVNEIAPRPHNSGHWTMDGAATCQFEQLVRAVCGLPLGPTGIIMPVEMENLIGDDVLKWPAILQDPNARLHLYGKAEPRPGRKMGHVNRFVGPS